MKYLKWRLKLKLKSDFSVFLNVFLKNYSGQYRCKCNITMLNSKLFFFIFHSIWTCFCKSCDTGMLVAPLILFLWVVALRMRSNEISIESKRSIKFNRHIVHTMCCITAFKHLVLKKDFTEARKKDWKLEKCLYVTKPLFLSELFRILDAPE